MKLKCCSKCSQRKTIVKFYYQGKDSWCKKCRLKMTLLARLKRDPKELAETLTRYISRKTKCKKCGRRKTKFYGRSPNCKLCDNIRLNAHRQALRLQVLQHYCQGTPRCMGRGCKVNCIEILELDHINNDGAKHKRKTGRSASLYLWLITHNFPPIIKVLCPNCHKARHRKVNWFKK